MSITIEHTDIDYSTDFTPLWYLTMPGFVVPVVQDTHGLRGAETGGSLSATTLSIGDRMEIEELLWNLVTVRDVDVDADVKKGDPAGLRTLSARLPISVYLTGCRFFQFVTDSSTSILVDLEETEHPVDAKFEAEYEQVINELRRGGREILAEELVEMLRICQEDPEETEIKLFSLQGMARFLIKQEKFEDPIVGAGPNGIMQAEWHIVGDGLLVMAFLEDNQIHCVVQTDADSQGEMLYGSVQLCEKEALEEFGYLVPLRQA